MNIDEQRLVAYIDHILDAIDRIARYTADMDEESFLGNELVQDAVVRNLEIIGEASHNVEVRFPQFASSHRELPFALAYQMRNAVAHGYFEVDFGIVWKTLMKDLPTFQARIRRARTEL